MLNLKEPLNSSEKVPSELRSEGTVTPSTLILGKDSQRKEARAGALTWEPAWSLEQNGEAATGG